MFMLAEDKVLMSESTFCYLFYAHYKVSRLLGFHTIAKFQVFTQNYDYLNWSAGWWGVGRLGGSLS